MNGYSEGRNIHIVWSSLLTIEILHQFNEATVNLWFILELSFDDGQVRRSIYGLRGSC